MDNRIIDVLNNKEDNYLLPFYWQSGNNKDKIPYMVEEIYRSGCKALCVESKNHPNFAKYEWFSNMKIILEECKKRDMKVWVLDDDKSPSGHANGAAKDERSLKKTFLIERHFDVIGPKTSAKAIIIKFEDDDEILGVYLFKRENGDESLSEEYIDLSDKVNGDMVYFDVPQGVFRLFIYFKSHHTADDYIDMLNPKATEMMIKNCYQPHYDNLGEYFGNTLAGFVSNEAGFYSSGLFADENYSQTVGKQGIYLPYSDDLIRIMSKKSGYDVKPYLVALWFEMGAKSAELRHCYMNTVSKLFSRYFTQKLGRWCASHGVEYIGHIVEDNNSHSKLGASAGHYFRSQHGQTMSGMDLAFQQVIPGFAHFTNSSYDIKTYADNEFFHYMLAKMCASDALFDNNKNGNAFCEVFDEDDRAQSSSTKKWLIDFLLVRGINHFAPQFSFDKKDPQHDAFSALMNYTNKASHLLSGGTHVAKALVLYNADCEWGSSGDFMYSQKICRMLYDSHIDFDIISFDYLKKAEASNNRLRINDAEYDVLFAPYSAYIYSKNLNVIKNLDNIGFDVVFVGGLPKNCNYKFKSVPLNECVRYFEKNCGFDVLIRGEAKLLRHYHVKRDSADVYMFFNESVTNEVNARIYVGREKYLKLDLLNDSKIASCAKSGSFDLKLAPYQSAIYVFDDFDDEFLNQFEGEKQWDFERVLNIPFEVSLSENAPFDEFEHFTVTDRPIDINSPENKPSFVGKIKYSGSFFVEENGNFMIDLGTVGEDAKVFINGRECGIRIAKPYVFDISGLTENGENTIEIIVSNTLVHKNKDDFSQYTIISQSGLAEEIKMFRQKQ